MSWGHSPLLVGIQFIHQALFCKDRPLVQRSCKAIHVSQQALVSASLPPPPMEGAKTLELHGIREKKPWTWMVLRDQGTQQLSPGTAISVFSLMAQSKATVQ